jgi:TonB family protein
VIQLLILQLAAAASAPSPSAPSGQGFENLRTIFSVDDYPPQAMQNGWQGDVVPELRVDATGHPTSCRVVQSSGYPILDTKTCEILLTRARFLPAKDGNGNPVEDTVRFPPVTWRIQTTVPQK